MKENHPTNQNQNYFAVFGNTIIPKGFCVICHAESFIQDDKFLCCGSESGEITNKFKSVCEAEAKRQTPNHYKKKEILQNQSYRCLYCNKSFGGFVKRGRKLIKLRIQWDHFIPYSFGYNNHNENFVASCQICNSLKSDFVFGSVEEAQIYLQNKRIEKGYEDKMLELPIKFSDSENDEEVLFQQMPNDVSRFNEESASDRVANRQRSIKTSKSKSVKRSAKNKKRESSQPKKIRKSISPQKTSAKPMTNFRLFLEKYGFSLAGFSEMLKDYGVDNVAKTSVSRLCSVGFSEVSEDYFNNVKPKIENACRLFLESLGKPKAEIECEVVEIFVTSSVKTTTKTIVVPSGCSVNYIFRDSSGKLLSVVIFG